MIIEEWDNEAKEVIRNFSSNEKDRLDAIIAMHIMACNMNDESAYMTWIELCVPDCPSEWDFIDFAQNDEGTIENKAFDEAVDLFKKLWNEYAAEKKGLYIGGKTY